MNHSVKRRRQALHQTHHHYYLNISVEAAILSDWRIESNRKNRFGSENRIESNRNFFCPNWNALQYTSGARNDAKTRADADYNFLIDHSSKINFDYSINFEQFLQSVRTTMKTAKFKYLLSYLCE